MAELRCPMCGKPNPDELDICQFCQARLKPLVIKPEEPSEDWLKPSNDDDLNDQKGLSQPEAPDWLRSLRSRGGPIEETNDEEAMSDPAEWLRAGLDDPDLLGTQRPESQDADWLADFRSRETGDEPGEQSLPPQDAEADDVLQSEIPGEIDGGVPDWLSGARIDSENDIPEPGATGSNRSDEDEEPEWLARIRANRQVEPMDQSPETSADQSDIPDWLKAADLNLESASEEIPLEPAPEEETPTWTSYFSQESGGEDLVNEPGELESPDEEPLLPEEDLPDWLNEGSSTPEETPEFDQADETAEPEATADDSPPWYATAPGRPFKPTDQLSQWLKMETTEPESLEQTPEEEIPEWLKSVDDSSGTQEQPPIHDEIPDEPGAVTNEEDEISSVPFETARRIEVPVDDSHLLGEDVHLEDEFASLEKELFSQGDNETPEVTPPIVEGDLVAGNEPPWLVELRHKMDDSEEKAESRVSPFSEDVEHELPAEELAGQELPDWLIDVHAQEAIDQITEAAVPVEYEEAGTSEAGAGLAQADLPAWLEAMRPVEAVAAAASDLVDERDQSIESAGPLAGIKGVLPVEADVTAAHKSGSFGLKLQVSDMQRARAEMLQELIEKESFAKPVPRKPAISSQRILQIIIAATLILAILSTLIIDSTIAKVPEFPIETGAVSEIINSLSSSDRVLVALDYQPAFSGEMEAAGSAVMDHLMLRGVQVTFVSTHPSGPLQAKRLVKIVNQRYDHSYGDGQVTNLGYISGGRAGILAFATSPRQLAPVTLDTGTNPWEGGALQGVTKASDFSLTMVITESPDTARMWIEQYQPHLAAKPLIMILSAQAEPIVRPYYEASPQQVQGIVSGTVGAAAYENLLGRVGFARSQWGAYSLGVLAACLLILLGGLINAVPLVAARLQKTKPGGDDQL